MFGRQFPNHQELSILLKHLCTVCLLMSLLSSYFSTFPSPDLKRLCSCYLFLLFFHFHLLLCFQLCLNLCVSSNTVVITVHLAQTLLWWPHGDDASTYLKSNFSYLKMVFIFYVCFFSHHCHSNQSFKVQALESPLIFLQWLFYIHELFLVQTVSPHMTYLSSFLTYLFFFNFYLPYIHWSYVFRTVI